MQDKQNPAQEQAVTYWFSFSVYVYLQNHF